MKGEGELERKEQGKKRNSAIWTLVRADGDGESDLAGRGRRERGATARVKQEKVKVKLKIESETAREKKGTTLKRTRTEKKIT